MYLVCWFAAVNFEYAINPTIFFKNHVMVLLSRM